MFSLHGRNAFITGGASGIGRAVAERFIAAGARVMIADLHDSAAAVARDIGAMFVRVDVGDEGSVEAALAQAESQLGKLHTVVNNAGVGDVGPSFEATPQALLDKVTRINQFGVLYGLKHAPKHLHDGGSIINTASLAAFVNLPGAGVYSAGKRAVVSMTEMSALELGKRRIRVNVVCPGYVATGMGSSDDGRKLCEAFTALGRVCATDDLVGAYHFLASDEASYITGQALKIDGGWTSGVTEALLKLAIGSSASPG